jgi:hypothetical protein
MSKLRLIDNFSELERQLVDGGGSPPHDGSMENRLTVLETRLDTLLPTLATKSDIGDIRADVQKVSSDISRWTLATMITIIGTMLAAIFGISQIYKSAAPTAAQQLQPIIIYAQPAALPPPQVSAPK